MAGDAVPPFYPIELDRFESIHLSRVATLQISWKLRLYFLVWPNQNNLESVDMLDFASEKQRLYLVKVAD